MARPKKQPTFQELNPDATSFEEVTSTSLYWFGMLPAKQPFRIKKPCRDKDPKTGDYYTYMETTSQELWEGDVNQWIGKCPWKQSLSVNGLGFDAFTETLMRPVGTQGEILNKLSWPGAIQEMEDDKAKRAIENCYKNVMRIQNGLGKEINLDQPRSYTMSENGIEKVTKEAFSPRTDTYFAHYVYLIKLEAKPDDYDRSTYYRLALSWDEFFKSPPASIAEMYPRTQAPTMEVAKK
jgi:hypothetical protein